MYSKPLYMCENLLNKINAILSFLSINCISILRDSFTSYILFPLIEDEASITQIKSA